MSSMMQRIITGAIFGVVVIGALLLGSLSFTILLTVICALTLFEYYNLQLNGAHPKYKWLAIVFGVLYFVFGGISGGVASINNMLPGLAIAFILFTVLDLYLNEKKSYSSYVLQGLFLVPLSLIYLHEVTVDNTGCLGDTYSGGIPLALLGMTWANDVGAYFIGKFFGKRKLFERISPNKTWGGFYGGVLMTMVVSVVVFTVFGDVLYSSISHTDGIVKALVLGACVSLFATVGDLYQSFVKRLHGVKDSGNLLPGHGGFWDRFDGFLFVVYGYMLFQFIESFMA